ncbi:RrF2 family transcriptional regulator [Sulfobacillus thermosulfidooxidans]|uniref:Transcriptional regulator, BadM/Rrf2 family n=2 Tax=Sulfobacillus thermosulfidooxidans TaxID=28034 RepID=A0A1W1WIJ6_SULTA|nr:Rrf2 family transcriptional regulator [Sulfobacillus thermosulfidooxidans]OLZ08588.1 AsnC family transcriptional regulator [Sulfobacillus thermosulfidooxidans]OLZ13191.1 AsnC family transcriptional regulator [Sulfobacillus thermosulfidooxidans]OLZ21571.1 AsnC family transcriptional regulator [Sulfobacillus thermosulfidooxidans]PSR29267.1 MAG: Rrf2 family transcriptional regulator [Sulfobacillus thermosulfidooxidans]SMC06076.1 transcriptional regulator, BadM/Rrf2 family [Sulfobacillus thermo
MIKISSKGRYGVKAVYELALHYGQGPVAVSWIAKAQNISEQYLEQLMGPLKKAGLVRGLRGAQGGYMLAKPPAEISVSDVVDAVEGPIVLTDCSSEDAQGCPDMDFCVGPDVWSRVQEALIATMSSMSFQMLIDLQREHFKRNIATLLEGGG